MTAARWPVRGVVAGVVTGVGLGAAASISNQLSSAYSWGAALSDDARALFVPLSLLLGLWPAWVLLPAVLGWWAVRRGGGRRGAAVAGGVGCASAVLAYYVTDAWAGGGVLTALGSDAGELVFWTAVGLPTGVVAGLAAAAAARRTARH